MEEKECVFTKEELKNIFDKQLYLFEIEKEYNLYKKAGSNILISIITTTNLFKRKYYNLQMDEKDAETFDFSTYPNLEEPSQDVYSEKELLHELRKLPDDIIYGLFDRTETYHEELPSKWVDLILSIKEPGKELKEFIERHPTLIRDCGWYGSEKITKSFIDSGIDMSLDEFGIPNRDSALHWSAFNGHSEVMKMLLDIGRPITDVIAWVGAKSGNVEVVRLSIQAGADYSKGYASKSIIKAVDDGNIEMVKLLLEAGCDPSIEGYKSFVIAKKKGFRGVNKQAYKTIYELLELYHRKQVFEKMSISNSYEEENVSRKMRK